ncbi:L-seryl-tRNA(Sec) selenium transferase [Anaerolineales bacterium HSG24]|nr:L-seryl-tRNA(Sec) selenium transferase [Anaerolineales bacterium HSG24]
MTNEFRKLPSVDKLLTQPAVKTLITRHGPQLVTVAARAELTISREQIAQGAEATTIDALIKAMTNRLLGMVSSTLQPVINATGVIIHTNLGRALLSERARQAMQQVASSYSNLEYDLDGGKRGSRYLHAADLLCRLTGAEAAVVVNNNAGAVILALTVLAQGHEVVISRSQLVEIGGGFRVPDIMAQSGARLIEVGTTNRTYLRDYEGAVNTKTGLLLTIHHSNYQIIGFTAEPTLAELTSLSQKTSIPLMEDLGSGTLIDTAPFGLAHEPTIQESITAGVDIVTASGDKLLGGPQVGLILGKRSLIDEIKHHPLIRALRVDKTTLAALHATLLAYLEQRAITEIPIWQMISAPLDQLAQRAEQWRVALDTAELPSHVSLTVLDSHSTVGGGSLPGQSLPTKSLAIIGPSPDKLAMQLRQTTPPIIARIDQNRILLDPRTVLPAQDQTLISNCKAVMGQTRKRE